MQLTILGAGRMGEALARGMLGAGLLAPNDLTLMDIAGDRVATLAGELGAAGTTDARAAVTGASLVILAVKPKDVAPLCRQISSAMKAGTTVLSIAAGVTLTQIAAALGRDDLALARAMPNTPALVSAGAFGVAFSATASAEAQAAVLRLLSPLGVVEAVPESLLDAVTGLSGSGPAFVALFIEALADGGVEMGLPRAQALRLAAQTVLGTAKLVLQTGEHPGVVKDAVASPGGTTIAGLAALEERGFRAAAMAAVRAAARRARELSGE